MPYNLLDDEDDLELPQSVPDISKLVFDNIAQSRQPAQLQPAVVDNYSPQINDEALAAAQERAGKGRLFAGLGDALDTIGHGLSGSTNPLDSAFYKQQGEYAEKPAEGILKRRKAVDDMISKRMTADALGAYRGANLGLRQEGLKNREEEQDIKRNMVSDKQADKIDDFDAAISKAKELKDTYSAGYTGPLNQYKSSLLGKQLADPNTVAYQSKIGRNADVYRKLITGAAAADKELARIESRLPQVTDPEDVFKAKADDYIQEVQKAKERYLSNLSRKGKSVKEYQAPSSSAESASIGLTDDKKKRLEELRKKKAAGTLGK